MRVLKIVLALLAATQMAAVAEDFRIDMGDFDELYVLDDINVVYVCSPDSAGLVTYSCEPEHASALTFERVKGKLRIQFSPDGPGPAVRPVVTVRSSAISHIENSGDSTVYAPAMPTTTNIKLRVIGNGNLVVRGLHANNVDAAINTGSGHIVLQGRTNRAKLQSVGTGPIEAGALEAQNVKCVSLGTGAIDCTAHERLTIVGAGSGKVYYQGNPDKVVNRTIGVKAIKVDDPVEAPTETPQPIEF